MCHLNLLLLGCMGWIFPLELTNGDPLCPCGALQTVIWPSSPSLTRYPPLLDILWHPKPIQWPALSSSVSPPQLLTPYLHPNLLDAGSRVSRGSCPWSTSPQPSSWGAGEHQATPLGGTHGCTLHMGSGHPSYIAPA